MLVLEIWVTLELTYKKNQMCVIICRYTYIYYISICTYYHIWISNTIPSHKRNANKHLVHVTDLLLLQTCNAIN